MENIGLIVPKSTKFLVSTNTRYELDAASEVWHCLYVTGVSKDIDVYFIRRKDRSIGGLIAIVFDGDPISAIRRMRDYLMNKPWILRYTLRVVPVEIVTGDLLELKEFVMRTARSRIGEGDSWKIQISKRATKISSRKLIDELAGLIKIGKVSLDNPSWIVNIEIIRDTYLASVIRPDDIIRKKKLWERLRRQKLLEYIDREQ